MIAAFAIPSESVSFKQLKLNYYIPNRKDAYVKINTLIFDFSVNANVPAHSPNLPDGSAIF